MKRVLRWLLQDLISKKQTVIYDYENIFEGVNLILDKSDQGQNILNIIIDNIIKEGSLMVKFWSPKPTLRVQVPSFLFYKYLRYFMLYW